MSFLTAIRFLTSIPLPFKREATLEEIGRSVTYFPLVGALIGLILARVAWTLDFVLPSAVVSVLLIVLLVIITGALHLDGLADTCDGIAGHKPVEVRLEVMRDSRIGGFGAVGIALVLLVKYVLLNSVPQSLLLMTLVIVPAVSRWAMVYAIFAYPYARPSGLGKVFKQQSTAGRFVIATLITLVVLALAMWLVGGTYFYVAGLVVMLGVLALTALLAAYFKYKFGGLTGDTYGAINEITEAGVLLTIVLLAHNGWLGLGG